MANEKRLIDANAYRASIMLWKMDCIGHDDYESASVIDDCVCELDSMPTVDAVEVVHGQWVRLDAHKGIEQFKCSICRSECYVPTCMNEPMYDYCPNCGAKMDATSQTTK